MIRSLARLLNRNLNNPTVPLSSDAVAMLLTGGPTRSGVPVTVQNALTLSAVWRSVSLLADLMVTVQPTWVDVNGAPTSPPRPNPLTDLPGGWTIADLFGAYTTSLLLHGNFYAMLDVSGTGRVRRLWPLAPDRVHPQAVLDDRGRITEVVYRIGTGNTSVVVPGDVMLHVRGLSLDGLRGMSVLGAAREAIAAGIGAETIAAKFYTAGSMPTGVLSTDQPLSAEEAAALKARWQQMIAGVDRAHEVVVLGRGAKFTPISITPEDAQFLEARRFGVDEVARFFGVPAGVLTGDVLQARLESVTTWLVVTAVAPLCARLTTAWNVQVARQRPPFLQLDTTRMVRADLRDRYAAWLIARRAGLLTANEVRRLEGWPEVDDPRADDLFALLAPSGAGNVGDANLGMPQPEADPGGADLADRPEGNDE